MTLAIDTHGHQLFDRTVTEAELKTALADATTPEYHMARVYQNMSGVLVSFAGGDDFRFDVRASAPTQDEAKEMARECEEFLAAAKKSLAAMKPDTGKKRAVAAI